MMKIKQIKPVMMTVILQPNIFNIQNVHKIMTTAIKINAIAAISASIFLFEFLSFRLSTTLLFSGKIVEE